MKCPCGKECSLIEEFLEYECANKNDDEDFPFFIVISGRYIERCPNENSLWHCDKKEVDGK